MNIPKISPSMMCADIGSLKAVLSQLEEAKTELLHIDIMDGVFVPNFTLGTDYCERLRAITHIPLDIHLMITNPEYKIDWFKPQKGEYISVHYESTPHIHRALQYIKASGAKAVVALNPATPVNSLENIADICDGVLIMTVNPGYAGQSLIPATIDKIKRTREFLDARGLQKTEIEVDGNVSFKNAKIMREAGADIFVAGSSSVFSPDYSLENGVLSLKEIISR